MNLYRSLAHINQGFRPSQVTEGASASVSNLFKTRNSPCFNVPVSLPLEVVLALYDTSTGRAEELVFELASRIGKGRG